MALSIKQRAGLLVRVWDVKRQCVRLDHSLDVLARYAQHPELGDDVRTFIEQFATVAEWLAFRNVVGAMITNLGSDIASYEGDDLPNETEI